MEIIPVSWALPFLPSHYTSAATTYILKLWQQKWNIPPKSYIGLYQSKTKAFHLVVQLEGKRLLLFSPNYILTTYNMQLILLYWRERNHLYVSHVMSCLLMNILYCTVRIWLMSEINLVQILYGYCKIPKCPSALYYPKTLKRSIFFTQDGYIWITCFDVYSWWIVYLTNLTIVFRCDLELILHPTNFKSKSTESKQLHL